MLLKMLMILLIVSTTIVGIIEKNCTAAVILTMLLVPQILSKEKEC